MSNDQQKYPDNINGWYVLAKFFDNFFALLTKLCTGFQAVPFFAFIIILVMVIKAPQEKISKLLDGVLGLFTEMHWLTWIFGVLALIGFVCVKIWGDNKRELNAVIEKINEDMEGNDSSNK